MTIYQQIEFLEAEFKAESGDERNNQGFVNALDKAILALQTVKKFY